MPKFNETGYRPVLSTMLTQEEFKAVFAVYWVAFHYRCYGAETLGPDDWQKFERIGTGMLYAIRLLADAGMKFKALEVDNKGKIELTSETPICPENESYIRRFAQGKIPWVHLAIEGALKTCGERNLEIDLGPLREALADVSRDVQAQRDALDPDEKQRVEKALDYLTGQVGMRKLVDVKLREDN